MFAPRQHTHTHALASSWLQFHAFATTCHTAARAPVQVVFLDQLARVYVAEGGQRRQAALHKAGAADLGDGVGGAQEVVAALLAAVKGQEVVQNLRR